MLKVAKISYAGHQQKKKQISILPNLKRAAAAYEIQWKIHHLPRAQLLRLRYCHHHHHHLLAALRRGRKEVWWMLSSHGSNYFSAALRKHGIPDVDTIEIVSMGHDGVRVCVCVCVGQGRKMVLS